MQTVIFDCHVLMMSVYSCHFAFLSGCCEVNVE